LNLFLFVAFAGTLIANALLRARDGSQPNYDFLPEAQMADWVAYGTFAPNSNFADGLTLRTPPAGTIARGQLPLHYQANPQEAIRAGMELRNPYEENDTERQQRGSVVFANYCQICHGPLGLGNGPLTQGGFPPPASLLADRAVQMKDGQMFHVLTYGQQNMPSFAAQLSREDRWNVILYVRTLQGPSTPDDGKSRYEQIVKVFRDNCVACHGQDGTGNIMRKVLPHIPDFTSVAWQMSQTEMAIVNQIDYGSFPLMPAFRYKLTQDQILGLAVYIRSLPTARTGGSAPAAPASTHLTARSIYGTFCFACHDTNGGGNPTMRSQMAEIPDFRSATWQKSRTDGDLAQSILQGKGKFMLPWKDKLGDVDVKQMVALVRGFEGGKQEVPLEVPKPGGPPPPTEVVIPTPVPTPLPGAEAPTPPLIKPGDTKEPTPKVEVTDAEPATRIRVGLGIFKQYCIVCHGENGKGTLMRAAMPAIPDFTSDAFHKDHSDAQIYTSILDGKGTLMPANRGRVTEDQARDLVAVVRALGGRTTTPRTKTTDANFEKAFNDLVDQYNELGKELQKTRSKKQ
jgi:mono/diheme cytochrome c family protein